MRLSFARLIFSMGIFTFGLEILPPIVDISLGVIGLAVGLIGFIMSFYFDFFEPPMRPITSAELLLTIISAGLASFDACKSGSCAKCCIPICPVVIGFALWMAAGMCSILGSSYLKSENFLYLPEAGCVNQTTCWDNYTNGVFVDTNCPEGTPDLLLVEVGSGTVASCFNSTHTCTLKESTGSDREDNLVLENCNGHALSGCWGGTDALCFGVSFFIALASLIHTCVSMNGDGGDVRV